MKNKRTGSRFEDFLAQEGILRDCRAAAIGFKIAHERKTTTNGNRINKSKNRKQVKSN